MRKIVAVVALVSFIPLAQAERLTNQALSGENKWLCIAEQVTGFKKNDAGEWRQVNFKPGSRYILQPKKPIGEAPVYGVFIFGADYTLSECEPLGANVKCTQAAEEVFYFSPGENRYLRTNPNGFWFGEQVADFTPYIEIGTCSKI